MAPVPVGVHTPGLSASSMQSGPRQLVTAYLRHLRRWVAMMEGMAPTAASRPCSADSPLHIRLHGRFPLQHRLRE